MSQENVAAPDSSIPQSPLVSIVVPAYNAEETLDALITSILQSEYPGDRLEVIIVDNNSTDSTKEIIERYPVVLLSENRIQSSYAARNLGIQRAQGEIIAFTDSDCVVDRRWIREGVRALTEGKADLVGGKIEFTFSSRKATAELCDAARHMRNDRYIATVKGSTTANLFVRAALFRNIGPFSPTVRSGGDILWTRKATASGHSLVYAPEAVVYHRARGLGHLLVKNLRLGTALPKAHKDRNIGILWRIVLFISLIAPPRKAAVVEVITGSPFEGVWKRCLSIWTITYLANLCQALGMAYNLLFRKPSR
ncbi:MAG TPA: glycosyl transferase [Deltaproteobacteria bacterium]|nr:glycosyl transferase [Deltaproteobacteria bacterium]